MSTIPVLRGLNYLYLKSHGDLHKPLHHLLLVQQRVLLLLEAGVEVSPVAEAHHDVEVALLVERVLVGNDVGMAQLGQEFGLLLRRFLLPGRGVEQLHLLDDKLV